MVINAESTTPMPKVTAKFAAYPLQIRNIKSENTASTQSISRMDKIERL